MATRTGTTTTIFSARAPSAPVITRIGQTGGNGSYSKGVDEPVTTITSKAEHLLVVPTLVQTGYGEREGQAPRALDIEKPIGTLVGSQKHAVVSAFLAQHNTGMVGHDTREPVSTIVGKGCTQAVVASHLTALYGTAVDGKPIDRPMPTITAGGQHIGEVRAFLLKYYGNERDGCELHDPMHTVTAKERFGLVTVDGEPYEIADIGMRMLAPRELYLAQGFPPDYRIDITYRHKPLTKTAQVRMCGNSVCPPLAAAIVSANFAFEQRAVVAA
jgi:DNA (cytosine-5)-methyltransferase 1